MHKLNKSLCPLFLMLRELTPLRSFVALHLNRASWDARVITGFGNVRIKIKGYNKFSRLVRAHNELPSSKIPQNRSAFEGPQV